MAAASMRDVENFGSLQLPLGGVHGYVGVRKVRDGKFQGYTPRKTHTTAAFETPHEAAVALALTKRNLELGMEDSEDECKPRRKKRTSLRAQTARVPLLLTCPHAEFVHLVCLDRACSAVALPSEPLTDRQAAPRPSLDASPQVVTVPPVVGPAALQRSAPVIAWPISFQQAAHMLTLGVAQALAIPLPV